MLAPWKKSYDQPRQHIKKQRHYFAHKGLYSQRYGFSSSQVWELDHKKAEFHWCFRTVVLEKTLESPLDSKVIKPVNPKGYQSWIFTGRTDASKDEASLQAFHQSDTKSQLTGKGPDAGKDWSQDERGWQRTRCLDGITDSMGTSLSKLQGTVKDREAGMLQSMGSQRVKQDWATEQQL